MTFLKSVSYRLRFHVIFEAFTILHPRDLHSDRGRVGAEKSIIFQPSPQAPSLHTDVTSAAEKETQGKYSDRLYICGDNPRPKRRLCQCVTSFKTSDLISKLFNNRF